MKVIYTDDPKILEAYKRIRNGELLDGETPDAIQTFGDRAGVSISPKFREVNQFLNPTIDPVGKAANIGLGATGYGLGAIPAVNRAAKDYETRNPKSATAYQIAGGLIPIPFLKAMGVAGKAANVAKSLKNPLLKGLANAASREHPILRNAALGSGASLSHDLLYDAPEQDDGVESNAVMGALGGGALGALGATVKSFLSPRYKANKFLKHFDKKARDKALEHNMPLYKMAGGDGNEHEISYIYDILSNYPKIRSRIPSIIDFKVPKYPKSVNKAYKEALKTVPEYNLYNSPLPKKAVDEYASIAKNAPDIFERGDINILNAKRQDKLYKSLGDEINSAKLAGKEELASDITKIKEHLKENLGEKYVEAAHMAKPFKLERDRIRRNIKEFKGLGEAVIMPRYNPANVPVGELVSKSIGQQARSPMLSLGQRIYGRLLAAKGMLGAMKSMNPKQNQIFNVLFGNPRISLKAMEKFAKSGGKYKNLPDNIIEALSRTKLYREDN